MKFLKIIDDISLKRNIISYIIITESKRSLLLPS